MLDKVKKIGKNTVIYGLGNAINKLLGLILIPVYTSYISINDFGILAILEITILTLYQLVNFGIIPAHERFFYREKEAGTYKIFLFSNFTSMVVLSGICLGLLVLFSGQVSNVLFSNSTYSFLVAITMLITYIEMLSVIPNQIMQYEEKPLIYILMSVSRLLLSLGATIWLVVWKNLGIEGVLLGRLIGDCIVFILALTFIVIPRMEFHFKIQKVKISIAYGFPVLVAGIGYLIYTMSDRFMLNWLADSAETGKYAFGYRIANFVYLLVQSIGISYLPNMFQHEKEENNKRFYRKMLTYYITVLSFIILSFLFLYKIALFPLVHNMEYWQGLMIVPILTLNFLFLGMVYFVNMGIILNNKTRYFLIPSFSAAIINIILNYWLIIQFGFLGAALATLISQIINTGLIGYIAHRFFPIRFEWGKIGIALGVAILFFVIGAGFEIPNVWLKLVIRIALLTLYPLILYKLNFFEPIEIERLTGGIKKLLPAFIRKRL